MVLWHKGLAAATCNTDIPYPIMVQVADVQFAIHLPANASRKGVEDGLSAWIPAAYVEAGKELPGFWHCLVSR